jgi:hypothetical protein
MAEEPRKIAERVFRAKAKRRRELARLPFEEKIEIVMKLQRMANGIRRPPRSRSE